MKEFDIIKKEENGVITVSLIEKEKQKEKQINDKNILTNNKK